MTRELEADRFRGPWSYRPNPVDDWGLVRQADGWPVANASMAALPDGTDLTAFRRSGTDPLEATGHLIAAAPELLEAGRLALGLLTGNMDGDWDIGGDPIARLRAAISKAEGRKT